MIMEGMSLVLSGMSVLERDTIQFSDWLPIMSLVTIELSDWLPMSRVVMHFSQVGYGTRCRSDDV